mgnify:CR=1 FL=1
MEILRGHIYRAKRPKPSGGFFAVFDDRVVVYVTPTQVQYDSPTVRQGRKFPAVDRTKFETWVGTDVTEGYPLSGWAEWVR